MVKPDRSRYVYVYMPSHEDKLRWAGLAKKANINLSKYVISVFENAIANEAEAKPRGQIVKELSSLRTELKNARENLKQKNIVIEKYEAELKHYRNEAFLKADFQGTREYNQELLAILKKNGTVDNYKLLEDLSIDPKEPELVKAVSKQLEDLEAYGLIVSIPHGWRWIG